MKGYSPFYSHVIGFPRSYAVSTPALAKCPEKTLPDSLWGAHVAIRKHLERPPIPTVLY